MGHMMLRLVFNDIRLNAAWFLWIFIFLNSSIILGFVRYTYPHYYMSIEAGISFATLMPLVLFTREEYYKGQYICRSIPVGRVKQVLARYVSVLFLGIAPALYGWLYQVVIEQLGPHGSLAYYAQQMESGYATEHSMIARGLALSMVVAVAVPLIIRFGSPLKIIIAYVISLFVWGSVVDLLLKISLHLGMFLGLSRWMFFASVLSIASLGISAWVSVRLHGRRDL